MVFFGNRWDNILQEDFESELYTRLREFLKEEYANGPVYPPMGDIFNALKYTDYDDVKVVLLGQDPYHGPGQAHGFAFSVQRGVKIPPSLQNMYKELQSDLGCTIPTHGNLLEWAGQGVLMLNAVLTVRAHEAASHAGRGWERFTDAVVRLIAERKQGVVYMLWGSYAQKKGAMVDASQNLVLKAVHPSPLSVYRGFFGSRHFSKANDYLLSIGKSPIEW